MMIEMLKEITLVSSSGQTLEYVKGKSYKVPFYIGNHLVEYGYAKEVSDG